MKKYRKKPVVIEASQWFKNGDHPLDKSQQIVVSNYREVDPSMKTEGKIVRYFRSPDISGDLTCKHCDGIIHDHGWIDTLEGGHIVCPGDFIITDIQGKTYPCKPDIFEQTYEGIPQSDQSTKDIRKDEDLEPQVDLDFVMPPIPVSGIIKGGVYTPIVKEEL